MELKNKLRNIDKQDLIDIVSKDSVDIDATWKPTKLRIECDISLNGAVEELKNDVKGIENSIKLKVAGVSKEDFGKNIARISKAHRKKLGITKGDLLRVEGKSQTFCMAVKAYPLDEGENLIRINSLKRHEIGVNIGDTVRVTGISEDGDTPY